MRLKYGSDNGFLEFLRHGGGHKRVIAVLICGVLLMLIGSASIFRDGEQKSEKGEEEVLSQMCSSLSGVGECRVMMSYEGDDICAVAVACEGGDIVEVRSRVCELISSLYGIGYNRITVLKLSE